MALTKKINILVIDDEELTQELLRHMLRELDLGEIDIHASCSKALNRFKKDPSYFGMIISDWEVPGMNGLEFLKEVRILNKEIPFLMVTGNASKSYVVKAVQAGVNDFLAKPFTANSLLKKVQNLIDASTAEEAKR
ncbi:response regulator [Planctobacterium marinum]|uniref:response regulator n=1 Tax=Planctobacterium marinum TaxID=1631968 RepID=UPI001E58B03B|nr:response regulator [Planctobacterium marinum]MCC2607677.1 response regulator [Planctobacterium marinum]